MLSKVLQCSIAIIAFVWLFLEIQLVIGELPPDFLIGQERKANKAKKVFLESFVGGAFLKQLSKKSLLLTAPGCPHFGGLWACHKGPLSLF